MKRDEQRAFHSKAVRIIDIYQFKSYRWKAGGMWAVLDVFGVAVGRKSRTSKFERARNVVDCTRTSADKATNFGKSAAAIRHTREQATVEAVRKTNCEFQTRSRLLIFNCCYWLGCLIDQADFAWRAEEGNNFSRTATIRTHAATGGVCIQVISVCKLGSSWFAFLSRKRERLKSFCSKVWSANRSESLSTVSIRSGQTSVCFDKLVLLIFG